MSKQKFFRGQRVRLADDFGSTMKHFGGKGGEAIVEGSYSDHFGCGNYSDFQLLVLSGKDNNNSYPYSSAWYHAHQMTLISDDRIKGEKMIQMYNEFMADDKIDGLPYRTYEKKKKELLKRMMEL